MEDLKSQYPLAAEDPSIDLGPLDWLLPRSGVLMRIMRGMAGALLWIVAAVLGLVAVVLCITIILLPAGLPLLGVSRRLFGTAVRLMLPREVAHPVKQGRKRLGRQIDDASSQMKKSKPGKAATKAGRKVRKRVSCTSTYTQITFDPDLGLVVDNVQLVVIALG